MYLHSGTKDFTWGIFTAFIEGLDFQQSKRGLIYFYVLKLPFSTISVLIKTVGRMTHHKRGKTVKHILLKESFQLFSKTISFIFAI